MTKNSSPDKWFIWIYITKLILDMRFDKNKSDLKNLEILKKEIKKIKSPYSKILIESLFITSDADELRKIIKERVTDHIKSKVKVNV